MSFTVVAFLSYTCAERFHLVTAGDCYIGEMPFLYRQCRGRRFDYHCIFNTDGQLGRVCVRYEDIAPGIHILISVHFDLLLKFVNFIVYFYGML